MDINHSFFGDAHIVRWILPLALAAPSKTAVTGADVVDDEGAYMRIRDAIYSEFGPVTEWIYQI